MLDLNVQIVMCISSTRALLPSISVMRCAYTCTVHCRNASGLCTWWTNLCKHAIRADKKSLQVLGKMQLCESILSTVQNRKWIVQYWIYLCYSLQLSYFQISFMIFLKRFWLSSWSATMFYYKMNFFFWGRAKFRSQFGRETHCLVQ